MKEMEGMKEAFSIFVDSCEKAGFNISKEEKVEEWPIANYDYFYKNNEGGIYRNYFLKNCYADQWRIKNIPIFKTEELCEKYYSIIDAINEIVDRFGRPSWDDFENVDKELFSIKFYIESGIFNPVSNYSFYQQNNFFPYCKKPYIKPLLEKVNKSNLLWAFKKSMRLI